jgi:hypothetical protein
VTCGAASCNGNQLSSGRHCDGKGGCASASSKACPNNLVCGAGDQCRSFCTGDSDCTKGHFCNGGGSAAGGTCDPLKPDGEPCNSPSECKSQFCVDGFCFTG